MNTRLQELHTRTVGRDAFAPGFTAHWGVGLRPGVLRKSDPLQFGNQRSGRNSSAARRAWHAFTLVELLVVIGVIAILASLILPALGEAKSAARKIACINKHKQWALALTLYANDNENEMPRESFLPNGTVINIWAQVRNPLSLNIWYNALPEQLGQRSAAKYAPLAFIPDFYDRSLLFHCPEAVFPSDAEADPITFFSIAMNSKLILAGATIRMDTIQKPSDTVLFLDNRLPDEPKVDPAQPNDELGQPSAYASRFVTRHRGSGGRRGVIAFVDGHAQDVFGREIVTNGWAIYPQTKIIWTADPKVDPNSGVAPRPP